MNIGQAREQVKAISAEADALKNKLGSELAKSDPNDAVLRALASMQDASWQRISRAEAAVMRAAVEEMTALYAGQTMPAQVARQELSELTGEPVYASNFDVKVRAYAPGAMIDKIDGVLQVKWPETDST